MWKLMNAVINKGRRDSNIRSGSDLRLVSPPFVHTLSTIGGCVVERGGGDAGNSSPGMTTTA